MDDATLGAFGRATRTLAELGRTDVAVAPWFLILPEAFEQCLSPWQLQALEARRANADAGGMSELAARASVPAALAREIEEAARGLADGTGAPQRWLVRSAEAGPAASRASASTGALVTEPERVSEQALSLWQEVFRRDRNSAGAGARSSGEQRSRPAPVLVQRVTADRPWGVATSADPATGQRAFAVVEVFRIADPSLGFSAWPAQTAKAVVRYRVSRENGIVDRAMTDPEEGGPGETGIIAAAGLARAAAAHFGEAQQVVWSVTANGRVEVLDCAPIPGLVERADPDAPAEEWLRGPVADVGGNTPVSPLTFSLARAFVTASARALADALDVPADRLQACEREGVFRRLVGQARGRLCLHLPSARRFLDLLPDDGLARRCFETSFVEPARGPGAVETPVRKTLLALARRHRQLRRTEARFQKQLEVVLQQPKRPFDAQRLDELLAAWHELESLLQSGWEAPALNNYLALVCDGLLRELSARWCGDAHLPNALLAGRAAERGDSVRPAEPAQRVREMAELIQNDDALVERLADDDNGGDAAPLDAVLAANPRLGVQFGDFLEHFAWVAPGSGLVESVDLRADPEPLTRAVGYYARGFRRAPYEPPTRGPDDASRRAEGVVQIALGGQRWRAFSYRWLWRKTRERLLAREAHGRATAQLLARARAIFLALGRRFRELRALDRPEEVFFLTVEEITGFLEGTAPGSDLRALVDSRRREVEENAQLPAPAERFTTRGAFYRGNDFTATLPDPTSGEDHEPVEQAAMAAAWSTWRGVPAFPGALRGRARRVRDARNAVVLQGEILVAERAEPDFFPLLAAAGGLILEHGSTLSRVAVVARDLGIPAVFGVAGIYDAVRDGELLELNGATGTVTRVGDG